MKSCFRIFQLLITDSQTHIKEAFLLDKKVFKYHEGNGDFKTYADAKFWLNGMSTLKGQFLILEIHTH